MFARVFNGLSRITVDHLGRRPCSALSNHPLEWKPVVDKLLRRTDEFHLKVSSTGFDSSDRQLESFALFKDWRNVLFKIPQYESKILHRSANSIDKLLHINLDKLSEITENTEHVFQPPPLLSQDLTTGIYAWGRTAKDERKSPVHAEVLVEKFLKIPDNPKRNAAIYRPTSDMYSALVYCWSQASGNGTASEKSLYWFRNIRANESMTIDSATWNALLRIHVRQKRFSGIEKAFLTQYSSLNDGYTFACLVEGWMNSGLPDGSKNAYKELQRGIIYCIDKEDQMPALNQLLFVYITQNIRKKKVFEAERVLNQVIGIQEEYSELEILHTKHFIVVMNALAAEGNIDNVLNLLKNMEALYQRGVKNLQPNYQVLVVLLSAILSKNDLKSLEAGEGLLTVIENYISENQSESIITNHAYNIMLNFYVRLPHVDNRRERVENLIGRMKQLAIETNNRSLFPDKLSYAALMKAIIREDKPGFYSEIETVLHEMEYSDETSMQPDRKVYAIALEALFTSDDAVALPRAKDLIERMKKHTKLLPDRVIYTILMKIHSLANDVHGSDEVLRTLIEAYSSGRIDCRPNEEAFVTAMSTWEQSGRRDAKDGAFRIFNKMTEFCARGNPDCQPSLKSFGKLMVILAKSEQKSKVETGRRLFSDMEKYGVRPDLSLYNWYIRVCGTVNSRDQNHQRQGWTEALSTFEMLRESGMANSHTYNSIFHACASLRHQDDHYSDFREIFLTCQKDGQVDRKILTSLKRLLPSKSYRKLTTLNPKDNGIQMESIPTSWKRNVNRYKKRLM